MGEKCMATTVISFNFGIMQQMLNVAPWRHTYSIKFLELLRLFRDGHEADMIFGCEIGMHREGPRDYHRQSVSQDLDNMTTVFCQNYMSAVRENAGVKALREPVATTIDVLGAGEPQLVLSAFQKETDVEKSVVVIVGNLHIRTPNGKKPPAISTRQRAVRQGRQFVLRERWRRQRT